MDIFRLMGRIAIDASDADSNIDKITKHAQSAGQKISKAFTVTTKGIGKMGSALIQVGETTERVGRTIARGISIGAAAVSTAAVAIGKSALDIRSSIEQGMGGAEAVFQQYAYRIQNEAKEAWETAGLSAEEYLATANKMGSLFKGAGFSEMQAMKYTIEGMQRAADVASIMGIDISTAMESIAGAAKGNFTMMDNLGVAMNETTLEAYRLEKGISTAVSKMTTAEKVELAMQMFFERTADYAGNYAKENETAAGSLQTLKAAWSNFLGNVGSFEDLEKSAFGYLRIAAKTMGLEGFEPMITGAQETVEKVAEILSMEGLDGRSKFTKVRRYLLEKFGTLASTMGNRIVQGIDNASDLISDTLADINVNLPHYLSVGTEILNSIRTGIKQAAAQLTDTAAIVAPDVIAGWFGLKTDFIDIGLDILGGIADGITNDLALKEESKIGAALKNGLNNVLSSLSITIPKLTNLASQIIDSIANAISGPSGEADTVTSAVQTAMQRTKISTAIQDVLNKVLDGMEIVLPKLANLATKIIDGIADALSSADAAAVVDKAGTILEKLVTELATWVEGGGVANFAEAATSFLNKLGEKLVELAPTIFKTFVNGIWSGLTGVLSGVNSFFSKEEEQQLQNLTDSLSEVESASQGVTEGLSWLTTNETAVNTAIAAISAAVAAWAIKAHPVATAFVAIVAALTWIKDNGGLGGVAEKGLLALEEATGGNIAGSRLIKNTETGETLYEQRKRENLEAALENANTDMERALAYADYVDDRSDWQKKWELGLQNFWNDPWGFALESADDQWNWLQEFLGIKPEIELHAKLPSKDATLHEFMEWWNEVDPDLVEAAGIEMPPLELPDTGDIFENHRIQEERFREWWETARPALESTIAINMPDEDATAEEITTWFESVNPELLTAIGIDLPPANATEAELLSWWRRVRPTLSANVSVNMPDIGSLTGSISSNLGVGLLSGALNSRISGFATGLDYVPRDNFLARLHLGEAVLTRSEADAWRNGGDTGRVEALLTQMNGLLQSIAKNTGVDRAVMLDTGVMVGQLAPRMNVQLGTQNRRSIRG